MSKSLSEEIHFALCCISECCVDESKRNITNRKAVEKIREYLSVITDDDRYSKNFNISLKREILQKDQHIAELEKENKELKTELEKYKNGFEKFIDELATQGCEYEGIMSGCDKGGYGPYPKYRQKYEELQGRVLAQAEKELKGEKL